MVSVNAGVLVGLATVPAKPFADTTETLVTVPVPPVLVITISWPDGVTDMPGPANRVIPPVRPFNVVTPALPVAALTHTAPVHI